jgi:hypothetical protein
VGHSGMMSHISSIVLSVVILDVCSVVIPLNGGGFANDGKAGGAERF